jgi:hypothetical protein
MSNSLTYIEMNGIPYRSVTSMAADRDIPRDIVTIRELARRWGKSEWTLSEWIRTGYLTVEIIWLKGIRHVKLRDAEKWLDAQPKVTAGVYKGKVAVDLMRKLQKEEGLLDAEPEEQPKPARVRLAR